MLTACRKFGDPRLVFDTGYNLMWTLHCHNYDADCAAFLKVVMSECTRSSTSTCFKADAPLRRAVQGQWGFQNTHMAETTELDCNCFCPQIEGQCCTPMLRWDWRPDAVWGAFQCMSV